MKTNSRGNGAGSPVIPSPPPINNRVLFACLALALLPIFSVSAQTPNSYPVYVGNPPTVDDQVFSTDTLPGGQALYSPRSGLNKATLGTLSSDIDFFMSALNWQSLGIERNILYAGVDEWGLNIGYGAKFGKLYLGVSYGGGLIDELYRRLTNQDVNTLRKKDRIETASGSTVTDSQVIDALGNPVEGINENTNTLQILLGTGVFGLKIGFAEALRSQEITGSMSVFESSLKPLLELGFNFRTGPVGVKFALRGAYDIHQYNADVANTISYVENPTGTTIWHEQVLVHSTRRMNYTEPSAGITLGFDFGNGSTTVAEFDIVADGAIRFYRNDDKAGVKGGWILDADPANPGSVLAGSSFGDAVALAAEDIFDLRLSFAPSFLYRTDLGQQLSIGVKFSVEGGFDMLTITDQAITGSASSLLTTADTTFSITPKLGAGAQFRLLPDRFAVQAGFGIELFSYRENKSAVDDGSGTDITTTRRIMGLPNASFAAGFTLNFTAAAAMDLLAISKNLAIDETKLTLLFTIRK